MQIGTLLYYKYKGFSYKYLYKAGARLFLWGYECHSPRIMEMMNKGIDVEKRLDILSDARDAGIWNNGLFIFGYPTETIDEIRDTTPESGSIPKDQQPVIETIRVID